MTDPTFTPDEPGDALALVTARLTDAADLWVTFVEQSTPTGTLDNRFLAEAEAAYFAVCKRLDRSAYAPKTDGWE